VQKVDDSDNVTDDGHANLNNGFCSCVCGK